MLSRRSVPLVLGLAAAVCLAAGPPNSALAGPIVKVVTDDGSLGRFLLTNNGGGSYTLNLITPPGQQLYTINGVTVMTEAVFDATINFTVTPGPTTHDYVISTGTLTKSILSTPPGAPNPAATMEYQLTTGQSGHFSNGLLMSGVVTSVPSALVDISGKTYDFSMIKIVELAFTATRYTGLTGAQTMWNVFNTKGATASGSASFSQAAIPEPTSVALLGIGLTGLIAFRRRFAGR